MKATLGLNRPGRLLTLASIVLAAACSHLPGADASKLDQEPSGVDPGPLGGPPSDAIVLFDGKDLSKFRGERSVEPKWKLENGVVETTPNGGTFSKQEFGDCQLHVEWAAPKEVKGDSQGRANSGSFLMGRVEIQVLD